MRGEERYKNQTELNFISFHHVLIHLETMTILASATENFDQKRKQHGIIDRQFQFNMTKMTRTILEITNHKNDNIKGSIASGTLNMIVNRS